MFGILIRFENRESQNRASRNYRQRKKEYIRDIGASLVFF